MDRLYTLNKKKGFLSVEDEDTLCTNLDAWAKAHDKRVLTKENARKFVADNANVLVKGTLAYTTHTFNTHTHTTKGCARMTIMHAVDALYTKLSGPLNDADQLSLRENLAAWLLTHDGEVLTAERANEFVQSKVGHMKKSEKRS